MDVVLVGNSEGSQAERQHTEKCDYGINVECTVAVASVMEESEYLVFLIAALLRGMSRYVKQMKSRVMPPWFYAGKPVKL